MEVWISTRKFNRETQLEHRYIHPCRTCISTHPCIHATSLSSLQHQFSPNDSCSRQQPMALRMNWNQVVLTILSGASPPLSVTRLNKHMHRPSISASSSNGARSEPALLVVAITCYLGGKAVAETANASTKIRRSSRGWWSWGYCRCSIGGKLTWAFFVSINNQHWLSALTIDIDNQHWQLALAISIDN